MSTAVSELPTYAALLADVVRPLLTEPDALAISEDRYKNAVTLGFKVHSEDAGRVIGSRGATIRAIRTTLEFAAEAHSDRVTIELVDD